MRSFHSATLVFALALAPSAFAAPPSHCVQGDLDVATRLLSMVQGEQSVGRESTLGLAQAQAYVGDLQFCLGKVSKTDYCKQQTTTMATAVADAKARHDEGLVAVGDYLQLLRQNLDLAAFCAE